MLLTNKTVVSLVIALIILIIGILINKLNSNVSDILEKEKCPACYGISACQDIDNGKITFEYTDFYSIFNNLLSTKNVYYGKYNDNKKVVMKKLAHKAELDTFDKMLCNNNELLELCLDKSKVKEKKSNFYDLILTELKNSDMTDPNNKIRLCPTIKHINDLLTTIQAQNFAKTEDYYKFLWTSIKINPEPIILQILPAEDDWPTPKYFGACGRLIIEEYIGLPLLAFKEEPWIKRAKIASSLLDAAYKFTFKNSKFAFYLTDISMDNIAINDQYEAIFVDLENIIIVDKYPPTEVIREIETWNETYTNNVDIDCQDCFVFSPADICSHRISDHNYYAICQHILTEGLSTNVHIQGLLYNPPDKILKQYPMLTYLLNQCARPNASQTRIDIGIKLKKLLDTIIVSIT